MWNSVLPQWNNLCICLAVVIQSPQLPSYFGMGWYSENEAYSTHFGCSFKHRGIWLVLATGLGNLPAVWVWTARTDRFGSRPGQKPDPLTHGGPSTDPYQLTREFCRVWLDPSVTIFSSAFWVSHLWSHSDMLQCIVKYWHWYCTLHFRPISHLDVQNKHTHAPNHILKMSVKRVSMIFCLASSVIWVVLDHKHP